MFKLSICMCLIIILMALTNTWTGLNWTRPVMIISDELAVANFREVLSAGCNCTYHISIYYNLNYYHDLTMAALSPSIMLEY